jgi:hypothetical protein
MLLMMVLMTSTESVGLTSMVMVLFERSTKILIVFEALNKKENIESFNQSHDEEVNKNLDLV